MRAAIAHAIVYKYYLKVSKGDVLRDIPASACA